MTNRLERIANATLLDAFLRDPRVLATVINKYGKIRVRHEDEMETEIQNIRTKIYGKAVRTVLISRRQELDGRVNEIIHRVMAGNSGHGRQQNEKWSFEGATPGEQNGTPDVNRWYRTMERGLKHSSSLPAFLKDLEILALLGKLASQRMRNEVRGDAGKIYAVGHNGQRVEINENGYQSYVRRQQVQQRKENAGRPPDIAQQPGLPGTNKPVPVPQEENED